MSKPSDFLKRANHAAQFGGVTYWEIDYLRDPLHLVELRPAKLTNHFGVRGGIPVV